MGARGKVGYYEGLTGVRHNLGKQQLENWHKRCKERTETRRKAREKQASDMSREEVAEILEWARHTCPGRMRRLANMGKRGVPTCA